MVLYPSNCMQHIPARTFGTHIYEMIGCELFLARRYRDRRVQHRGHSRALDENLGCPGSIARSGIFPHPWPSNPHTPSQCEGKVSPLGLFTSLSNSVPCQYLFHSRCTIIGTTSSQAPCPSLISKWQDRVRRLAAEAIKVLFSRS